MRSWEEVHRLHDEESKSGREIARLLGMSRNTVGRLLALGEPPCYKRSTGSKLDSYRAAVIGLLHDDPKMPATLVYRRLTELGYEGGTTAVRELVAAVRRDMAPISTGSIRTPIEPDPEPGMNLISVDFDIMMVNRVNERLFKKPMVELLGKKCYREFERRENVCPHCPGLAALASGVPHQVESRGIRDDGTKYAVRLTAHPIMAPNGAPVGFVEVEEDITERKRSERLAELVENLQVSLAGIHDVAGAVRQALNVAFSLDGVDFGCAYIWDQGGNCYRAVAQRGVSKDFSRLISRYPKVSECYSDADGRMRGQAGVRIVAQGSDPLALVPIVRDANRMGLLLLGSSTYTEFPLATQAAFEALTNIVGAAVASFQALQLERETRSDLENLLGSLPLPIWCTDEKGRITLWNRAAESILGWGNGEVNESGIPRSVEEIEPEATVELPAKTSAPVRANVIAVPAPRALGEKRHCLFIAQPSEAPALRPHAAESSDTPRSVKTAPARQRSARVLLQESESAQRRHLIRILQGFGCRVHVCRDSDDLVSCQAASLASGAPYDLMIAELLPRTGRVGLELASSVHHADPAARIVLTADARIEGFESHGLAGALRKPYEPEEVRRVISDILLRPLAHGTAPETAPKERVGATRNAGGR